MAKFEINIPTEEIARQVNEALEKSLENLKSANDFVRVVRCRDCVYYREGHTPDCGRPFGMYSTDNGNGYCSYGERKDYD